MKIVTQKYFHKLGFLFLSAILVGGCGALESLGVNATGSQSKITGEPLLYRIDTASGAILDRDVQPTSDDSSVIPHKGEIIAISMDSAFVKHLREVGNAHVLIYAQVFDDGTNNPDSAVTKVLFNGRNQPPDVHLGFADSVIYGPTSFKGFPIRVVFTIVELDKDQKQLGSRILDAVGGLASSFAPQAGPAIGVAVQVGQLVNALDEDDFELRYEFTLSPFGAETKSVLPSMPPEQKDRVRYFLRKRIDKSISLTTPLRTGKYAILKRELRDREGKPTLSNLSRDFAQLGISRSEAIVGKPGESARIVDVLVYQGGYFQKLTVRIKRGGKIVGFVPVIPSEGPNKGVATGISIGGREIYRDNTYVVFTIQNGLPHGLTQEALAAGSQRDKELITKLLDNSTGAGIDQQIGDRIDNVALAIGAAIQQRRIASSAGERVGRDKGFRKSTEYPVYWTSQLQDDFDTKNGDRNLWTQKSRNAIALNRGILSTLNTLILNMPPNLRPDNKTEMTKWKAFGQDNFLIASGLPGVFCYTETPGSGTVSEACRQQQPAGPSSDSASPTEGANPPG